MFFWLYALIELLALFLDSGIIPTSNAVYPVRKNTFLGYHRLTMPISLVVHSRIRWSRSRRVYLSPHKRLCRLSIRRRRYTNISMGQSSTLPPSSYRPRQSFPLVSPYILPSHIRPPIFHIHRHLQEICRLRLQEPHCPLDHLHPLAPHLRRRLYHLPARPRLPHPRRPLAAR